MGSWHQRLSSALPSRLRSKRDSAEGRAARSRLDETKGLERLVAVQAMSPQGHCGEAASVWGTGLVAASCAVRVSGQRGGPTQRLGVNRDCREHASLTGGAMPL